MEMKDNDDFADCIKSSVEDIHIYVSITEYEVDEEDDEEEEEDDAEEGDEPEEEEDEKWRNIDKVGCWISTSCTLCFCTSCYFCIIIPLLFSPSPPSFPLSISVLINKSMNIGLMTADLLLFFLPYTEMT